MKTKIKQLENESQQSCLNAVSGTFSLKQQFEQEFIPAIRRMAEKERKHLEWLQTKDQSNKEISYFTLRSNCILKHLNERLEKYIKYAKSLS